MRIFVTGGSELIGSNVVRWVLDTHVDVRITHYDALTYAGDPANRATSPTYGSITPTLRLGVIEP